MELIEFTTNITFNYFATIIVSYTFLMLSPVIIMNLLRN